MGKGNGSGAERPSVDERVRLAVYAGFARRGGAADAAGLATELGLSPGEVRAAWRRLADGRVLVLQPDTGELWMAMPFSAVATPHLVTGDGTRWWANCAWDALAIPGMVGREAVVTSDCPDCGEEIAVEVGDGEPVGDGEAGGAEACVHFLVPARHWWEDIGFT